MTKLLLVGCGKMGGSLLGGWLDKGFAAADIVVVDPVAASPVAGLRVVGDAGQIPSGFVPDVIVLAVKPQMMDQVAPAYAVFAKSCVYLSIAAGKTIAYYQHLFGKDAAIVRAMPNTPAAVRRGITAAVANPVVSGKQKALCGDLLEAVSEVVWLDDEGLIDAVTAVSGSGPAYVFLLAETLAAAGVDAGLAPDVAARLARVTVSGSGELLARSSESAAQLRQNVTSPAGTTYAALQVLMGEGGFKELMSRAVAAAQKRSRELAG